MTNWGQNCSDIGKEQLEIEADCIDAAELLGLHLETSGTHPGSPGGCFLNRGNHVHWNKNQNGPGFKYNRGICLFGVGT